MEIISYPEVVEMRLERRWFLKLLAAVFLFVLCVWQGKLAIQTFLPIHHQEPLLILDAGHGGEDGGAVSAHGTKESDLNLSIVLRAEQLLAFLGEPPLLLRREDISLHETGASTLREKKVSDIKNRVNYISGIPGATLVSVHQNSYPEPQYRGAQVFYAPTDGSQQLAKAIQCALAQHLQPENTRQEKQIPDGVYLMNHIENRAILVECGFLTNPEEESLLLLDDYQKKLVTVIGAALALYTGH